MGADLGIGLLLVIFGGILEGSFSLPLKYTPKWEWENTWGMCSLLALLLVPWPLAFLTVPNLAQVYSASSSKALLAAWIYGAGWGTGGIFFGLGLDALGLSVGLSLIMGLIAITGSLVPLILQHPEQFGQPAGLLLLAGIAVMVLALCMCAKAGGMKDAALSSMQSPSTTVPVKRVQFGKGLALCIAAGLLSALVNFALIFGADVTTTALRFGASKASANNALWAIVFTANYAVNAGYCAYLTYKKKTFKNFFYEGTRPYWFMVTLMGLAWALGIVIYGIGAAHMGPLGAIWGFPLIVISAILTGNVLGFVTGEWKGTRLAPKLIMGSGIALLLISTAIIVISNKTAA